MVRVAIERDGSEVLFGSQMQIQGQTIFVPFVGTDRVRIESYRSHAIAIAKASGRPIQFLRFSEGIVIERWQRNGGDNGAQKPNIIPDGGGAR
jgi:hypothetical protein